MKARRFNSIMPWVHEAWAARVLNMTQNMGPGADLYDSCKVAEVKFTLIEPRANYPRAWTVQDHQLAYCDGGKPAYWALGTYTLSRPVSSIRATNEDSLDNLVTERTLWIIHWDWMQQHPSFFTEGETRRSKWENTFRYPKLHQVPGVVASYSVDRGIVHLTKGVDGRSFRINGRKLKYVA